MGIATHHTIRIGGGNGAPEFYKYDKFLWLVASEVATLGPRAKMKNVLRGPFCPKQGCRAELDLLSDAEASPATLQCSLCETGYKYKLSFTDLRRKTLLSYEAKVREDWPVVALDQPPADLQVEDEDDGYWLAARIGTKNGKRVGVVYFGEKKADQGKRDYAQLFLDFDDEQIRHDPTNMDPSSVISKLEVDFKDTHHTRQVK